MGFNFFKRKKAVLDLSSTHKIETKLNKKAPETELSKESPLGFLGNLASLSEDNKVQEISSGAISTSEDGKAKIYGLLRDMKSKMDSNYSKLYKLSDRLDLLERKIERLERKAGI